MLKEEKIKAINDRTQVNSSTDNLKCVLVCLERAYQFSDNYGGCADDISECIEIIRVMVGKE